MSSDEVKNQDRPSFSANLNRRSTFSSALSGSVSSLNSLSSSRSRASSTHDDPLSTSSSSASLSSVSQSQHQGTSSSNNRNQPAESAPFVDRRKSVGGKIKPFVPDYNNENERRTAKNSNGKNSTVIKRSAAPGVTVQKRKSLQLTIISPSQIQQTAKLGREK